MPRPAESPTVPSRSRQLGLCPPPFCDKQGEKDPGGENTGVRDMLAAVLVERCSQHLGQTLSNSGDRMKLKYGFSTPRKPAIQVK